MPRIPDIAIRKDLAQAEIMRVYALDHSWTYRVEVGEARADGSFAFTAEVVREYEPGGRWCWYRGTVTPGGPSTIDALDPCSFGPEGVDQKVVRARRRSLGRPVLDEDRVHFAEAALRSHVKDLPRYPLTRVGREHVEGNATVFDFATVARSGKAPRNTKWYVGTVRVDLDTFAADASVREAHVGSAVGEEAWRELGFPPNGSHPSGLEKRSQLTSALHAQVRAQPRDGELRLALAKQLEQEGDPQGELIRLCCTPPPAEREARDARIEQLLAARGEAWYPAPPRKPSYWNSARYLEGAGIPDHLYPSFAEGLTELAWWTRHYPLRFVSLLGHHDWTPLFRALEAGGHLARLERLIVTSARASRSALAALGAGSPGLQQLDLGRLDTFDPLDLAALAEGRLLTAVKTLNLDSMALHGAALEAVWPKLVALEHLRATDTRMGDVPMDLGRANAPKLQSITIGGGWDEAHVLALWNAIDPAALKVLRVNRVELGGRFLGALADAAASGRLDVLEVLDLAKSSLTSLRPLLVSPPAHLRVLRLENNKLTERDVRELTAHPFVGRLRELGISKNHVYTGEYMDVSAYGYDPVAVQVTMGANQMRAHFSVPAQVLVV